MNFEIVCAYFLDFFIGDPRFSFHPVRIIGKAINGLEKIFRRTISSEKLGGSILAVIVVGFTYVITWLILKLAGAVSLWFVFILNILLIYFTISVRDLAVHSHVIREELKKGNLDAARKKLSMIVGRDTEKLNEQEIIRGTVESVAESTVDGVISPLFYAFIGGAPLAMAFKAISTLDSMAGYKNEKYINFGWLGAKLDDIANFIPARLSAILIPLAACFTGFANANRAWWTIVTDGGKSNSPNAGIPEAAYAGALGIQLGGINIYGGIVVEKPLIGEQVRPMMLDDISEAIKLMFTVSAVTVIIGEVALCVSHLLL